MESPVKSSATKFAINCEGLSFSSRGQGELRLTAWDLFCEPMAGFANDALGLREVEDGIKTTWSSEILPPSLTARCRCHSRCLPLSTRSSSRRDHCNLDPSA